MTFASVVKSNPVGRVFWEIFNWYPSTLTKTDRKLLLKLDRSILIFASLSFFCKYLDQSNITNAYVSGMKEDVGLAGNDLNYLNVAYFTAYVVGQVPMVLLQSRPRLAPYFLPSLEVVWAVLTFAQSRVSKPWHLYLIRAMVGFAEAPSFGGTHLILGSWYRPEELFKRAGMWFMGNSLGSMFSGYLQAAAYKNLNGVRGLAGWQWLFIVDGVITLPIAVIGFTFFPGLPSSRKPWFLTEEEHQRAKDRMDKDHKQAGKLDLGVVKRTLKGQMWWLCVAIYILMINSSYWSGYMSLWFKAARKVDPVSGASVAKYSVEMINVYPTFVNLISALSSWIGTTLAGTGLIKPWQMFSFAAAGCLIGVSILTAWSSTGDGAKFFAFYISGLAGMQSPILYSWINTVLKGDLEQRALVIGSMMTLGYAFYVWVPLLIFQTVDAPQFKKGYPASVAFVVGLWALTMLAMWSQRRRAPVVEEEVGGGKSGLEGEKEDSEGSVKSAYAVTAQTTDIDGNLIGH